MVKRFPLNLLIVFTVISMAALSAVAKNIAQKRTIFGDPLCKIDEKNVSGRTPRITGEETEKRDLFPDAWIAVLACPCCQFRDSVPDRLT